MNRPPKTEEALDRRDRRLMHRIWLAAVEALEAARQGHNDKWRALQNALEKAEDEIGPPEEYEIY